MINSFHRTVNPKLFKRIKRQLWPILTFSVFYFCALSSYILNFIYLLVTNKRELMYKMIPAIEFRNNLWLWLGLLSINVWIGFIVTTLMFGEGNILGLLVFHLNGRYQMMQKKFYTQVGTILKSELKYNIVDKYDAALLATLKENIRLNRFAAEIQKEFSFRIFVMFSFSAISLCALGFKVYTVRRNLFFS